MKTTSSGWAVLTKWWRPTAIAGTVYVLTWSQNGNYLTAGELVGTLSEKAAADMGLPPGIAVGSGVIDAYAGWIGTVGAKVKLDEETLDMDTPKNDVSQAFTRLDRKSVV